MLKINGFKAGIAIAIALGCLSLPRTLAQQTPVQSANLGAAPQAISPASSAMTESGIQPQAMELYNRAVRELHQGHAVPAEKDALRALQTDKGFADAAALAATAALKQQQFDRARTEAAQALQIDAAEEKAWVILATADNYLAQYSDAAIALGHVSPQDQETWQVAYQWARAEAGLQHLQPCLDWANRAALSAPPDFAPLHLLRASALLATGDPAGARDQLEIYLQLPSVNPTQRDLLTQELHRLRQLPQPSPAETPLVNHANGAGVSAN